MHFEAGAISGPLAAFMNSYIDMTGGICWAALQAAFIEEIPKIIQSQIGSIEQAAFRI
jgi:hypothetical protein